MRARNREINIFNMSLLDILCGALGAFCFMMLVLLPYYRPPGKEEDLRKQQKETQDLLKEMEKLREQAKDSAMGAEMTELMQKMEEQIKQLQGQVNQFATQNQQLKTENENLAKKNDEQDRLLRLRRPFLVMENSRDISQDVDLYLADDTVTAAKKTNPPFDPAKPRHDRFWVGDLVAYAPGRGVSTWVVRDSPPNVHYKIYVKLANEPKTRHATAVVGGVFGDTFSFTLPDVLLSPERFWALAGTLASDAQGNLAYHEATQEERDAEWKQLSKSAPPAPPTPSRETMPFSSATASPMTNEQRRAILDKLRERSQQQRSPVASPTASTPSPAP